MSDITLPDGRTAQVVEPQQQNTPAVENPANFDTYIVFLENLRRMKQHQTTAPTFTPKNFLEQIQFYDNGTNRRLYLYINKVWRYIALT